MFNYFALYLLILFFKKKRSGQPLNINEVILAEFGSLQLELVRLSQITGDRQYEIAGNNIIEMISHVPARIPGLYPMIWDLKSFKPKNSECTFPTYFEPIISL